MKLRTRLLQTRKKKCVFQIHVQDADKVCLARAEQLQVWGNIRGCERPVGTVV